MSTSHRPSHNGVRGGQGGKDTRKDEIPVERGQARTTPLQWAVLGLLVTVLPYFMSRLHYSLPTPLPPHGSDGPQPSEELILAHIQALETIGYRTVGTPQARAGERYVEDQVRELKSRCDKDGVLDCDVWVQTGDGFHEFTLMDHDVLKVYKGITNIIFQIRAKEPPSGHRADKDAMLLGAHIDSTLPAPGAADDGIGVGVMLDIARVLVDRKKPFDNSVIFMWNGGEETLQDGSHLYSTQHETGKQVRAVINLEAAGSTGGALLFQATSKEMVEAFSYAPHPRGTVVAADVFASGVLMSDTDFIQFEQYLNVSGLDMAIVGHSYFYHTQKDLLEHIEPGAAQHFANNVQAILDHLLCPASPLHSDQPWSPPNMVYLSLYDRVFVSWSMETATKAYSVIAAAVVAFIAARVQWGQWKAYALALLSNPLGQVAGIVSANLIAGVMVLLGRSLSWFKHEQLCLVLFLPAALVGNLSAHYLLSRLLNPVNRGSLEHAHNYASLAWSTASMLLLQSFGIRSAYLFAVITVIQLISLLGNEAGRGSGRKGLVSFSWAYGFTMTAFTALGVEGLTTILDIFTPLTGRMGKDAPAEFIIATLATASSFTFFPNLVPLFHRLSRPSQRRAILALALITITTVGVFAGPWWKSYDAMHPKRAGVQYTYNHTTSVHTANIAFMDSGPEFDFVEALHERYGTDAPVQRTVMNKANSDWDVLYPVSSFLDTYRFELPSTDFAWPKMGLDVTETRGESTRKLDMRLNFTGIVWPTLAFNADIIDWSFDFPPPTTHARHHVKIATAVDQPIIDLSITVNSTKPFSIHWIGIDLNQMVPGTAREMGPDMPGSKMLLDLHDWAKERYDDSLEILTYAAVAGIVEV